MLAFMDLQSMDRRDPKFERTLEAGLSNLVSVMEIYHWQSEQGRWFLHEDPHHTWSQRTKALQTSEFVSGARVTKTKQFGTFMTNCHPIVEELAASVPNPEMFPIAFATSVLRGWRRTLAEVTGAVDNVEAGPTVEEECPVQKHAHESGETSCDEATGLPLDPEMVADAVKDELMFMRKMQVYRAVLVSYLDKSGLKAIGTRWVYTNKGDAANPLIRARLVAQETKRVSELTPADASSTFTATPSLESLKVMLSPCVDLPSPSLALTLTVS